MASRSKFALSGGLFVALAACAGDHAAPSDDAMSIEDFAAHLASATCDEIATCDQREWFQGFDATSLVDCPAVYAAAEQRILASLRDGIARGTIDYDGGAAARCYRDLVPTCDLTDRAPAACDEIVRGMLRDGDVCASNFECPASEWCSYDASGTCGVCAPFAAAIGSACGGTVNCLAGSTCIDGSCVARIPLGDPCATHGPPCAEGRCLPAAIDGATRCTGAPFEPAGVFCVDRWCRLDQVCGSEGCRAPRTNGTCEWQEDCALDRFCLRVDASEQGTCTPFPSVAGASCAEPNACAFPVRCVHAVCAMQLPDGSSCDDDHACVSEICTAGRCGQGALCAR